MSYIDKSEDSAQDMPQNAKGAAWLGTKKAQWNVPATKPLQEARTASVTTPLQMTAAKTTPATTPLEATPKTAPATAPLYVAPTTIPLRIAPTTTNSLPVAKVPTTTEKMTTATRPLLYIPPGNSKKIRSRSSNGRRIVISIAVTCILALVVFGTLMEVMPSANGESNLSHLPVIGQSIMGRTSSNTGSIAAQAATATVVTQDGYDAGSYDSNSSVYANAGLPTPPPDAMASDTQDHFPVGQCTYWAALRYYQDHGKWVPWYGNAGTWAYQAPNYGWTVTSYPRVGTIIVLAPDVQGAGGLGHVAYVESILPNGDAWTSNWNWAGTWETTNYVEFHAGWGVSFVG